MRLKQRNLAARVNPQGLKESLAIEQRAIDPRRSVHGSQPLSYKHRNPELRPIAES